MPLPHYLSNGMFPNIAGFDFFLFIFRALKGQEWWMFQHHHLHQTIYFHHLGVQCWEFLPWEMNLLKPLWVYVTSFWMEAS